jgi:hypothetical protein
MIFASRSNGRKRPSRPVFCKVRWKKLHLLSQSACDGSKAAQEHIRTPCLRDATASLSGVFGRDERLDRVVDVFSEAITVVAYNLDYDSYLMFKTHAPVVFPGGSMQWTRSLPTDPEVVRRCLNFVIDTAIRLEALA